MTSITRHQEAEARMRELLAEAGLPAPDDVLHGRRAVVFLWYETKAFVLVDLEELPDDADPLDGLDVTRLAIDLDEQPPGYDDRMPGLGGRDGFIEAA